MKNQNYTYYLLRGNILRDIIVIATFSGLRGDYEVREIFSGGKHTVFNNDRFAYLSPNVFQKPLFESEDYQEVKDRFMLEIL